jgi:hypothetical protein
MQYTGGDDCLALKGNATNVLARNFTCRGGNGIAIGSLGQYTNVVSAAVYKTSIDVHNLLALPDGYRGERDYRKCDSCTLASKHSFYYELWRKFLAKLSPRTILA